MINIKNKHVKTKRILSILILTVMLLNMITTQAVQAMDLINSNSIIISVEKRVLGEEDIISKKEVKLNSTTERAAEVFDRVLKESNIEYENTGSIENLFYVSSIKDNDGQWVGEFDHGNLSGWKYSVNGVYPNEGLSEYYLKANDVIRISYTAKDMGTDIVAVDKIYELRESIAKVEGLDKLAYTEESFSILENAVNNGRKYNYSNEEIGKMMSEVLGDGSCDTDILIENIDKALGEISEAIDNLVEKEVDDVLVEDVSINLHKWYDTDFNVVYLQEGQDSINALLEQIEPKYQVSLNGELVQPTNGKYIVKLKKGFNKFVIVKWGKPKEINVKCTELPYIIEGNLTPGSSVRLKLIGLEESVKHTPGKYELEKSQMKYKTDIPGVTSIESELCEGNEPDRDKLSTIQFTIPKDTEPGEYTISNGAMYHKWAPTSIDAKLDGDFSIFPEIKINIEESVQEDKIYDIDVESLTDYSKVYTTDDKAYIRVSDNGIEKVIELSQGINNINVNNKDFSIECKRISYKVENSNKLIPGSKVKINFTGIEGAVTDKEVNSIQTIYKTNIDGIEEVKSEEITKVENNDYSKLNTIEFDLPTDIEIGEYKLLKGIVYEKWSGDNIEDKNEGTFSILPNINFTVKDKIPDDLEAPEIQTTLKDGLVVSKSNFRFDVSAFDNEDGDIKPLVIFEGDELTPKNSNSYNVQLLEGENIITIKAEDAAGNSIANEYKIICTPNLKVGSSIILDTLSLELDKGEKHQLIAVNTDDYRSNENELTERMIYEVVEGKDIVKVSKTGVVEAVNYGLAKISVKYPGLKEPAIVLVNVNKPSSSSLEIATDIMSKYDIYYFNEDNKNYSFTVNSKDADTIEVKVNGNVIQKINDTYTTTLNEGYNDIEVIAKKDKLETKKLFSVRAKEVSIKVSNLSNQGNEIVQGDKVRVEFTGLETPVPKFLRVFNPKNTRVNYYTDVPGMLNVYGKGTQYDIAKDNAIEFIATRAGEFTFTNGHIEEHWWGDELYSEREITGETPNLSAVVRKDTFSSMPDFTISVKENPEFKDCFTPVIEGDNSFKPGDEVIINIEEINMPDHGNSRILQARTIFNTDIKGLEIVESMEAKENSENLKTIKFILPNDIKPGEYTITNGRVFKEWDDLRGIYKEEEFYKGEIPEIKINVVSNDEKPDEDNNAEIINEVIKGINNGTKWTLENIQNPSYEDEWSILGLVRSDVEVPDEYYDMYYKNLEEVVIEKKGVLHRSKYTEYSRVVITLTALGKDPTNVGGYNLLEKLYNYKNVSKQGINGVIYALIAIDSNDYKLPEEVSNLREQLIEGIISKQLDDGGFALTGKIGDVDITAMALQALSKYKDNSKVNEVIDKAVSFLETKQLNNGGFESNGDENLESTVQVLVALNSLGISINDSRFVKDNNNLINVIMSYAIEDGGFKHMLSGNSVDGMATEQALYGLASQYRVFEGKTTLYDMSDVVSNPDDEDNNSGENDNEDNSKPGDSENEDNSGSGGNNSDNEDDKVTDDDNTTNDNNDLGKPEIKPEGNINKPTSGKLPQTGAPFSAAVSIIIGLGFVFAGKSIKRK